MVDDSAEPLLIVGMEGFWGLVIMVSIVFPWAALLPGADQGECLENVADSWVMIQNSGWVRQQATGETRKDGAPGLTTCACCGVWVL